MRVWNGLNVNDIVYYNNKNDSTYRVIELYELNNKKYAKIESVSNRDIVLNVGIELCKKVK